MFSGLENFPSPPVCSVSVVLFWLFRSAEHSGRSESRVRNQAVKSSCEIKLRLDRFSHASGLFRFRGFVSALRVGGTRGAVGIEVVKSGFGRRSVLRLRFVPFPWFCFGSSGWLDTRGGQNRASKSSFGVRNVFRNGKLPLIISLFII